MWSLVIQTERIDVKSLSAKFAWHGNRWLLRNLWLLNLFRGRLTVIDQFGGAGDTLMTATVCRVIKQWFPRLRINCATRNPDIIQFDPSMAEINGPTGLCYLSFEYLGIVDSKASDGNILAASLNLVGINDYEYKARIYLRDEEIAQARRRIPATGQPVVTINVMSKELVKVWRLDYWRELIARLLHDFTIVHLGDDKEPLIPGVLPFGGKLNKRESMAMLAIADVHIGPDSFLMHAANGLKVPSVIIYGGSRPPTCLGYDDNRNIFVKLECSPCWLHTTKGETCPHDMKCMSMIGVDEVYEAILELADKKSACHPSGSYSAR
jgi:ADP-heptose:LPS heptosyltransferase